MADVARASVELVDVEKRYGSALALDRASLALHPGRVHAIVGENGAGKSTLLKIAAGVEVADAGRVHVLGSALAPATTREAIHRGVGMVHQHFMLVPTLTGAENLALGVEPTRFGLLHLAPLVDRVRALARELSLSVPLDRPIETLSVGERQRLEILRVLARGAKVLILDEPTAVLAPREARAVLELARTLATQGEGRAVALVTHHLDEVTEFADEVTVLRHGRVVAHHAVGDPIVRDARALAREALAADPPEPPQRAPRSRTRRVVVVHLDRITVESLEGSSLRDATLEIAAGEILGVAGVEGNGQQPLEHALVGKARIASGAFRLDGVDATNDDVRTRRRRGVAWIPSDRHAHGLADALPAADVLRLGALSEVAKRGVIDEAALAAVFADAVATYDLRPDDRRLDAGKFSGGNQQKLVVARELRRPVRLVVAAHPTRGVDLRVAATIRARLIAAAEEGAAIVVISSDLDELRTIADRIVVLRGGRISAELPKEANIEQIGEAMLG